MAALSTFDAPLDGVWAIPSAGVVLDLTDVSFTIPGIRGVVGVHHRCAQDDRSFEVRVTDRVMYLLNLPGLAQTLGVASSRPPEGL